VQEHEIVSVEANNSNSHNLDIRTSSGEVVNILLGDHYDPEEALGRFRSIASSKSLS
jgi:hypothetical protein